MKDYLIRLAITIVVVAATFGILIGLEALFGVWGVIGGFLGLVGLSIWGYNYSNKKEQESCPHYNEN